MVDWSTITVITLRQRITVYVMILTPVCPGSGIELKSLGIWHPVNFHHSLSVRIEAMEGICGGKAAQCLYLQLGMRVGQNLVHPGATLVFQSWHLSPPRTLCFFFVYFLLKNMIKPVFLLDLMHIPAKHIVYIKSINHFIHYYSRILAMVRQVLKNLFHCRYFLLF